ncbi:hypothetical protein P171DRAFT_508522 [Karstenula rhodostoma CBS 690.94]|uniref:Uncharacterized protein n=1 Tax=Karstenula rhodostoma CBS 690.94 TaxID=1392251 RepID=A0A9P4PQJ0_9PLEO|nr:hypothetical protein P171DRAFT_508522 [Karstenula rhodostoma CBS 690.94]
MPLFSSRPQSNTTPNLTFIGPDAHGTIYIEDARGIRTPFFAVTVAKHSKPSLSVNRILPSGHQAPFFTSHTSSLSGASRINLINRASEIKVEVSYEGMQLRRGFHAPMGKLGWFPSGNSGCNQKLKDKNATVLAKLTANIGHSKEPRLELLVPCDDYLVDLIVATGMAVYRDTVKEVEQVGKVSKVIGGVFGG